MKLDEAPTVAAPRITLTLAPALRNGPGTRLPRCLGDDPSPVIDAAMSLAEDMGVEYYTALALLEAWGL